MNETISIRLSERIIRKWMKKGRQLQYYLARICVKKYASILYSTCVAFSINPFTTVDAIQVFGDNVS